MTDFFKGISKVKFEGPSSNNPLAFRHYNKDELVNGKRMEDIIRPAVAYWHTFAWEGGDPFGGRTFDRPWYDKGMEGARIKADVAFELFELLDMPFFCFHDADIAPEGATLAESNRNVREIGEIFARKMEKSGTKLLWGTANLFSNRRYMAGAATNPDPEIFAYAAGQVKNVLELTHELGGANYVLWGGREGYETLLNTKIGQEQDQMGRLLAVGGGSRSETWLKMIATNLDAEISVPEDGDFGGALGAARLGLCAAEGADPTEVMTMPGIKKVIGPDAALRSAYSDQYARYRALYPAIEEART